MKQMRHKKLERNINSALKPMEKNIKCYNLVNIRSHPTIYSIVLGNNDFKCEHVSNYYRLFSTE